MEKSIKKAELTAKAFEGGGLSANLPEIKLSLKRFK